MLISFVLETPNEKRSSTVGTLNYIAPEIVLGCNSFIPSISGRICLYFYAKNYIFVFYCWQNQQKMAITNKLIFGVLGWSSTSCSMDNQRFSLETKGNKLTVVWVKKYKSILKSAQKHKISLENSFKLM